MVKNIRPRGGKALWSAVLESFGNILGTVPTASTLWSSCFLYSYCVPISFEMQIVYDTPAAQQRVTSFRVPLPILQLLFISGTLSKNNFSTFFVRVHVHLE